MKTKLSCLSRSRRLSINFPFNWNFQFFNLLIIALLLLNNSEANGQNPIPPLDSYVNVDSGTGTLYVAISDSTDLSEIEVVIGSKSNNGDIFSNTYVFDQTTGLPSGLSYSRSNLEVFLGLGPLTVSSAVHVQVRIKNGAGNWSSWYEYISN